MRLRQLLPAAFLLACTADDTRGPADSATQAQAGSDADGCVDPRSAADTAATPPFPGWHDAEWSWGEDRSRDLGHGVIHRSAELERGQPCRQVTRFHAAPDAASEVVGALVTDVLVPGWTPVAHVWAPRPLEASLVEFAYEESGLPYDSIDATGRWHRAILGFTDDAEPAYGWVQLGDSALQRTTWKERLVDAMLFPLDEGATFHSAPDGPVVTTSRALAKGGYDMTAVEAQWPWLRVKVEHPGEACAGELPANRRTDHYWIRALDERERPTVFYFTRGC